MYFVMLINDEKIFVLCLLEQNVTSVVETL